jgi:hypothetical protein
MTERLLQFIWRYQYFNPRALYVETGEPLQILSPGTLNTNQGPDFLRASIRIGETVWVGSVELHLCASGWERHAHGEDRNYNNVILHVVWEDDAEGGWAERAIPLLVLQPRVPKLLLGKYGEWMKSRSFVACAGQVRELRGELWSAWKRSLLMERLERKTEFVRECLRQNHGHWDETAWWMLARIFVFSVNAGAFEATARSLPFTVLYRHRHRPEQLEALLLGQAGLLEQEFADDPAAAGLKKEFYHLRHKYRLRPIHEPMLLLRMRPGNFPAVRLVQLAGLIGRGFPWFGKVREAGSVRELKELLEGVAAGEKRGEAGAAGEGSGGSGTEEQHRVGIRAKMGASMKGSILINTFLPLLFAYGSLRGLDEYRKRALEWMEGLGAENNWITRGWLELGATNRNAADSQSLIELKTRYCEPKGCLGCDIGKALLGVTEVNSPMKAGA